MKMKKFDVDVLVVGGGVAGVAAAISTARAGQRTLLLEKATSLGGLVTNGYVTGIAGMIEGICKEWLDRLDAEGDLYKRPHLPAIDPEKGKLMLEQMLLEAGARVLYGMYAVEVNVEEGHISDVVCYSKSGRMEISAKIIIDTTGDADIAFSAGVPFEVGSPEFGGLNMSTTLAFRMSKVNMLKYQEAIDEWRASEAKKGAVPSKMSLYAELQEKAVERGDLPFFIFPAALIYPVPNTPLNEADITVMTTHSFYTRNTDVEDLTRQIIEQHQQIMWIEKFFRDYIPGFEECRLANIANLHGVRDSRRIVGEYILKDEDVVCARKFEDGIARFPEFLDTHHPINPRLGFIRHVHLEDPKQPAVCRPAECSSDMHPFVKPGGYEARVNPREYCEIPYRALVPLKIDNLLVAGRCMSAEFHALAAVRVIATSMSTGQAAGIAAALCLKEGILPRLLDGKLVRKTMIEQGIPLDKNLDDDDYWKAAKNLKGEYVVMPGDFAGILTSESASTYTHSENYTEGKTADK